MFTYAVARDPAVAGYAMVSERFLAVVSADADDETALRLWRALSASDSGATTGDGGSPAADLASVLSAMSAETSAADPGFAAVADFAVVELVDAPTRSVALAVRGGAQIVLAGGDVRTGEGSSTWRESAASEVAGLTLQLGPAPALLGSLPLGRGIVRADRLDWGLPAEAVASPEPPVGTIRREQLPEPADDRTELSRVHRRGSMRPVLRLSDGRELDLDLPVVFGRSPKPAAHPGARLITLPSPRREISGAHLEVRLDAEAIIARDLGSTNGTIVRDPDGAMQLLLHGASAALAPGATLDLGDDIIATVDVADGGR